jgi:hypothetical protein
LFHGFFSVLLHRNSWKSNNFRKRAIKKEAKNLYLPKRLQRGLRVITLQGLIKKSPILLSQYWKNDHLKRLPGYETNNEDEGGQKYF